MFEQRSQHPEARVALPLVVERRPGNLEHQPLTADVLGRIAAFPSDYGFQERRFARCRRTRSGGEIDDLGGAQVELIRGNVALSHDCGQRP